MPDYTFDDAPFRREAIVNIDAAVVGISKSRWMAIEDSQATIEQAAEIMRTHRFDVLPIDDGTAIKSYFLTDHWNDYTVISRRAITHRDIIPSGTGIRDVIKGLATESRLFYFLGDEDRIAGLVSVANLNARQVKVYLFSLLSDLEMRLGQVVNANIPEDDVVNATFGPSTDAKYRSVRERYQRDRANGVEVPVVEYLYLSDFIQVINEKELYRRFGYERKEYAEAFASFNKLRQQIAHPTRSIVTHPDAVGDLWRTIDRIEEALFRLRTSL